MSDKERIDNKKIIPTPEQIAEREEKKKERKEARKKEKHQMHSDEIKKFKRKDRLMTLVWIVFFPFMITDWLWKTDKIKYRIVKILIIVFMWFLIIRLALHIPGSATRQRYQYF